MKKKIINVASDFTDTPWGRFLTDGDYSGQRFREQLLLPALKESDTVDVLIDDAEGYGSSFLDEAFGGLVRIGAFTAEELRKKLKIITSDSDYEIYQKLIWKYINEAKRRDS